MKYFDIWLFLIFVTSLYTLSYCFTISRLDKKTCNPSRTLFLHSISSDDDNRDDNHDDHDHNHRHVTRVPKHPHSISRNQVLSNIIKGGIIICTSSLLSWTNPVISQALVFPECADSISVLQGSKGNKQVVLIGTAHISEDSAEQVRRTIRKIQPDVVMIELDVKRLGLATNSVEDLTKAGFDIPTTPSFVVDQGKNTLVTSTSVSVVRDEVKKQVSPFINSVRSWIRQTAGTILGKTIGQFYKSVEKLGFKAGGEFQAAVEEGRNLKPPARILLGDRDVNLTLERLAAALSTTDSRKFESLSNRIISVEKQAGIQLNSESLDDKTMLTGFIEGLKQRKLLNEVLTVVKEEVPMVYSALIGERDAFMANSIATSKGDKVVAVVGMAHMTGIENNLAKQFNYQLLNSRSCPK